MDKNKIIKELKFKAIRSGGPGGQHANKVSSKIVLFFDLKNSEGLNEGEKIILSSKLHTKLTMDDLLILKCDESRSQFKNKKLIVNRLMNILSDGIRPIKKRKATKPSIKSVQKRLHTKKILGLKKVNRKKPNVN
jgi:ribosome-associated protein